jgi:hypothetical protein
VSRGMRMDDGVVKTEEKPSHVQHVRFEFRYDAHGNWTERIVWQRMEPNADERPSNIERRAINFYGHEAKASQASSTDSASSALGA